MSDRVTYWTFLDSWKKIRLLIGQTSLAFCAGFWGRLFGSFACFSDRPWYQTLNAYQDNSRNQRTIPKFLIPTNCYYNGRDGLTRRNTKFWNSPKRGVGDDLYRDNIWWIWFIVCKLLAQPYQTTIEQWLVEKCYSYCQLINWIMKRRTQLLWVLMHLLI